MTKVRFINIVRVTGFLLVLTYHLFETVLPGGFLGVDVFFTLSGYLITSSIISCMENNLKFDFFAFIKRRFIRIFPTLFFSILFTLPLIKLISSDFTVNIDKQVCGALGFVTNYFEIINGGSYNSKLVPHLYVHTWSLAVEFHYYLFWGIFSTLLLFIISKIKNMSSEEKIKKFKHSLLVSSIIFAVASYLNMQFLFSTSSNYSSAYFATTSHISPLFIGSILGTLFGLNTPFKIFKKTTAKIKIVLTVSFLITLIILVILCVKLEFENYFVYKYGILTSSILTSILIVLARELHKILPQTYTELTVIKHISNISYPMYLFHWPLFIIFSNVLNSKNTATFLTLVVSYVFTIITLYHIEPIFHKISYAKRKPDKPRKKVSTVAIACVSVVCLLVNLNIFTNKKDLSDLENEQMTGKIIQNMDKLEDLKSGLANPEKQASTQKNDGIENSDKLSVHSQPEQVNKTDLNNVDTKITMIGDSVALGARKTLLETISNATIDTEGSRPISDGYEILMKLQESNDLGNCVIIALGTNGNNDWKLYIEKIINELNSGHRLIFVTPYDGRWSESWYSYQTTQYLRDIDGKYPFVSIVDWAEEISKQTKILGSDKVHIGGNKTAIKLFVDLILDGLNEALSKPAKGSS